MCGRYYRIQDKQAIAEYFHAEAYGDGLGYVAQYNIAPTSTEPVICASRDLTTRKAVLMRWGLIGHNSSVPDPKRSTFNARAETIATSPLWRVPFRRRRCLVPISGFYEWKKSEKIAYRFCVQDAPLFALAGLWDAWRSPDDGQWLQSFTIVTTEANGLIAPVHDRMPVILKPADYSRWLSRDESDRLPMDLLRPFDADAMTQTLAHPKVGNIRSLGAEMLNSV